MFAPTPILNRKWGRWILLIFLCLCAIESLQAAGVYQDTKDGKTKVWNSAPKPGDTATWVGDRNRSGYAHGFGTLTWYTGSGKIFARYYGNMVDGKFAGPVNAHSNGRVAHAIFSEGMRVSPWAGGKATLRGGFAESKSTPAPTPKAEEPENREPVPVAKKETQAAPSEAPKKTIPSPTPAAPKAKTITAPQPKPAKTKSPAPLPSPSERPSPELYPTPTVAPPVRRGVDESLQSLVGPPSSLNNTHPAEKASDGPLTKSEVVDVANTIVRTHGYNPANYTQPTIEHNETDETWSISYDAREGEGESGAKHLSVSVDGKSKRASIASPEEPKGSP